MPSYAAGAFENVFISRLEVKSNSKTVYRATHVEHEKMFFFPRRAMTGCSMPTWLLSPGPILLRRHVRTKGEPLCDQVHLLDANPSYAKIQFPDGKEDTVSTHDLASCPVSPGNNQYFNNQSDLSYSSEVSDSSDLAESNPQRSSETVPDNSLTNIPPRRSERRIRKAPDRFGDWTQ